MSIGPVEYIAIAFPGNKFSGEIIPAIKELQDSGTIRVLDLVIITKDGDGNVAAHRAGRRQPGAEAALAALGVESKNLLGQEDFEDIGSALDPNSTAALMIWENVWAARFAQSLRDADGILVANGRIPAALIEELMGSVGRLNRTTTPNAGRKELPQMMRRRGGLVRMAATTAVVAGTAGAVCHHQQQKYAQRGQATSSSRPPRPRRRRRSSTPRRRRPRPPAEDPTTAQIQKLAELHAQGILSDEEFAAAKAKALGI